MYRYSHVEIVLFDHRGERLTKLWKDENLSPNEVITKVSQFLGEVTDAESWVSQTDSHTVALPGEGRAGLAGRSLGSTDKPHEGN